MTRSTVLAAVLVIPFIFFLLAMVDAQNTGGVLVRVVLGGIIHAAFAGVHGAYFSELLDTKICYSGVSLGFSLGAVLGGGMTPHYRPYPLRSDYEATQPSASSSVYVSVLAALALVATLASADTLPQPPTRRRPADSLEVGQSGAAAAKSAAEAHSPHRRAQPAAWPLPDGGCVTHCSSES